MVAEGGKVDEIPPERTLVVTVLLGCELIVDEHIVSRVKAVTRQGEVSGDVLWWVGSSTAVEEGQSSEAKGGEMGLDILNNTRK